MKLSMRGYACSVNKGNAKMRTELLIQDSEFFLLSRIISASMKNKKIRRIGTSIGSSFLISVGSKIDVENIKRDVYEWSIHVFNCKWRIHDLSRSIIRSWNMDSNLDDLAEDYIGKSIIKFGLEKNNLRIEITDGIEISIDFEPSYFPENEVTEDIEDISILAIEYQKVWALNIQRNGDFIVDL